MSVTLEVLQFLKSLSIFFWGGGGEKTRLKNSPSDVATQVDWAIQSRTKKLLSLNEYI